jgi:hypothetical protein
MLGCLLIAVARMKLALEIIIVDDGSLDGILVVANQPAKTYSTHIPLKRA